MSALDEVDPFAPYVPPPQGSSGRSPLFVTFGRMRLTGYFRHQLDEYAGGQKVVVQSDRGVELGEITVSHCATCPAGSKCSKPRNQDRRDRESSPIGRVLRPATPEDLAEAGRLEVRDREIRDIVRKRVADRKMPMKVIDAERLLGGERLVVYFGSEQRIDFRELVKDLAREFQTRIEMRQIGARDEARLLGEGYGRCGEPLCCQSFLQDLKNVPMKMAKTQKQTLDPNKVSGRCGRLMCCLRYEDDTYEDLKRRLPERGRRVRTPDGDGTVLDTQTLTQLVMVELDAKGRAAFGVEDISTENVSPAPPPREDYRERRRERERRDPAKDRNGGPGTRPDRPNREPEPDETAVPDSLADEGTDIARGDRADGIEPAPAGDVDRVVLAVREAADFGAGVDAPAAGRPVTDAAGSPLPETAGVPPREGEGPDGPASDIAADAEGRPTREARPQRTGRPDRPERPERPERPSRPDRPGRPGGPSRGDRPGGPPRGPRRDRPERGERPDRPGEPTTAPGDATAPESAPPPAAESASASPISAAADPSAPPIPSVPPVSEAADAPPHPSDPAPEAAGSARSESADAGDRSAGGDDPAKST